MAGFGTYFEGRIIGFADRLAGGVRKIWGLLA